MCGELKPEGDPVDVGELSKAVEHRVFAGTLDRHQIGLGERPKVHAVRASAGDLREWEAIDALDRHDIRASAGGGRRSGA